MSMTLQNKSLMSKVTKAGFEAHTQPKKNYWGIRKHDLNGTIWTHYMPSTGLVRMITTGAFTQANYILAERCSHKNIDSQSGNTRFYVKTDDFERVIDVLAMYDFGTL